MERIKRNGLADIAERIRRKCHGSKRVCIGDVIQALEHRGYGPLLLVPVIIIILPTGAIPGVPDVAAFLMILIAAQMLAGRKSPWVPERLEKMSFKPKRFETAARKAVPWLRKIDGLTHRRAVFFTHAAFQKIIALLLIFQSILIVLIGMIPFVPDLLVLPVLLLALGLSMQDGILALGGFILMAVSAAAAVILLA